MPYLRSHFPLEVLIVQVGVEQHDSAGQRVHRILQIYPRNNLVTSNYIFKQMALVKDNMEMDVKTLKVASTCP